jgi:hypothetical protein
MSCKFKKGEFNCGSYAFNLYKEDIDQGNYCDHHYWQDQAMKARADEREACAKVCETGVDYEHPTVKGHIMENFGHSRLLAKAIRARGNT